MAEEQVVVKVQKPHCEAIPNSQLVARSSPEYG